MADLDIAALDRLLDTRFIGRLVVFRASIESTQDLARAEAENGAPEGTIVIADEQTAGRGRQGRSWVSPPGSNLYFTLVLRPSLKQLTTLAMAASVAIAKGISEATGLSCGIKWPNDVMVSGKKISGILLDSELDGNNVRYVLAGIGINVNFDPRPYPEIAGIATSVLAETGAEAAREEILAAVLNSLETRYLAAADDPAGLFEDWKRLLVNLGRDVVVHDSSGAPVEGFAESVKNDGTLVLRLPDGTRREFPSGQLSVPGASA